MVEFKKKVLDNGLTVLFERRDVPVTTVMLAVKYGSGYETMEEKGMAHFIEHLCFKGTKKRSAVEIAREVEGLGGDLNAFTHEEVTAFHVKLPSEHLDRALDVVFDVFFNPTFPEEEVKKEALVIVEEIKMYRDNPHTHTIESVKKNLYDVPFGEFIGGSEENVLGFSREDLFGKHEDMYKTSNAVLCVVGNNDFDEVIELVQSMDVKVGGVDKSFPEVVLKNAQGSEKREGVHQTNLALGFHFPKMGEKGRYVAEVFSSILGEGMSSKLFSEVREKRGLVYSVKSDLDIGERYGYMIIWAGCDSKKKDEVVRVCREEFSRMGEISEEELEKAKVKVVGNWNVESESSDGVATDLIMEEVGGDASNYYRFEEMINSVTLDDIKDLASIRDYSLFSLEPKT